ncbi:conserved hypothetical protein, partial [Listeria monocytogenes FSL F2-208]
MNDTYMPYATAITAPMTAIITPNAAAAEPSATLSAKKDPFTVLIIPPSNVPLLAKPLNAITKPATLEYTLLRILNATNPAATFANRGAHSIKTGINS